MSMDDLNKIINFFRPLFTIPSFAAPDHDLVPPDEEIVSSPITADVTSSTPTQITLNADPSLIELNGTVSFQGTVLDQNNAPIPNCTVTISIYSIGGSSPAFLVGTKTASTTDQGTYATSYTFNQIGTFQIDATTAGIKSNSVGVSVEEPTGVPSALTLSASPTEVEIGGTVSFTGMLSDAQGYGVPSAPIYVDIKDSEGQLITTLETQTLTAAQGITGTYAQTYVFDTVGLYTIQARAPTSFAYGVTFPDSQSQIIKVYEADQLPMVPDWLLPVAAIGTAALLLGALAYTSKKR